MPSIDVSSEGFALARDNIRPAYSQEQRTHTL